MNTIRKWPYSTNQFSLTKHNYGKETKKGKAIQITSEKAYMSNIN